MVKKIVRHYAEKIGKSEFKGQMDDMRNLEFVIKFLLNLLEEA